MEERLLDMIDRYLRDEMTKQEKSQFEQLAVNDEALRRELGLVLDIKRSLAARQRKLRRMKEWSRKMRCRLLFRYGAAAAVIGAIVFTLVNTVLDDSGGSGTGGTAETEGMIASNDVKTKKRKSVPARDARKDSGRTADMEEQTAPETDAGDAPAEVEAPVSKSIEVSGDDYMSMNEYERDWNRILALQRKGDSAELLQLLTAYVKKEGRHKAAADSMLQKCRRQKRESSSIHRLPPRQRH